MSRVGAARANRRRAEARGVLGAPRLRWSPRPECLLGMGCCRIWGAAAPELLACVRLSTPLRSPYVALSYSRRSRVADTWARSVGGARIVGSGLTLMRVTLRAVRGLPPAGGLANQANCAFAGVGRRRPHHRVYLLPVLRVVSTHDPCDESLRSRKICGRASPCFTPPLSPGLRLGWCGAGLVVAFWRLAASGDAVKNAGARSRSGARRPAYVPPWNTEQGFHIR